MITEREALTLALEALENMSTALGEDDVLGSDIEMLLNAAAAIRVALAQPERPWVGLTDEQIYINCPNWLSQDQCKTWVRQIEAALKEKNT